MARYKGPKFKLARREGVNVTGATSPRLEQVQLGNRSVTASWLERDGAVGRRATGMPKRNDIDADIREDLIVES